MKSAVVSIIGRPSSGKSSLMNAMCGQKIAITSPSPQTTRNALRGILTASEGQLLFLDTPGYHTSEKRFNQHLQQIAVSSLNDSDIVLYVADATRQPGEEEQQILSLLSRQQTQIIGAVNKCDLSVAKPKISQHAASDILGEIPFVKTSAETGQGIQELIDTLFAHAPEGDPLYPEEYYTDQSPEFRIAELIREQVINRVSQEVPHAVYVEVSDIEFDEQKETLWIRAFINVERESQKGIIVGKQGTMIRAIRKASQKELRKVFSYAIKLDLRVKVQQKWRRQDAIVKKIVF